jgi:hypothetical protein
VFAAAASTTPLTYCHLQQGKGPSCDEEGRHDGAAGVAGGVLPRAEEGRAEHVGRSDLRRLKELIWVDVGVCCEGHDEAGCHGGGVHRVAAQDGQQAAAAAGIEAGVARVHAVSAVALLPRLRISTARPPADGRQIIYTFQRG